MEFVPKNRGVPPPDSISSLFMTTGRPKYVLPISSSGRSRLVIELVYTFPRTHIALTWSLIHFREKDAKNKLQRPTILATIDIELPGFLRRKELTVEFDGDRSLLTTTQDGAKPQIRAFFDRAIGGYGGFYFFVVCSHENYYRVIMSDDGWTTSRPGCLLQRRELVLSGRGLQVDTTSAAAALEKVNNGATAVRIMCSIAPLWFVKCVLQFLSPL